MGERQRNGDSNDNLNEYQDEYHGISRYVECRRSWFFYVVCISIVCVAPQSSSAGIEKCTPKQRCWKKISSKQISFKDGVLADGIESKIKCAGICYNNDTCTGAYYGFKGDSKKAYCYLQMPSGGVSETLTKAASLWKFSKCTDNCLPYCWKPKFDKMKTQGRKNLLGAKTEAECKEMCSTDRLCDGVDWLQPNKSCWHDYRHVPARPDDNFHHWEIVRDVLTHCPKDLEEKQCMSYCWKNDTGKGSMKTFENGLFKKDVNSENDCKELCASDQSCAGVYWGLNKQKAYNCWFRMNSSGERGSLEKANYWSLSKCTDDCLAYCWQPKLDNILMNGGMIQTGINKESQCKVKCAKNKMCAGIDFHPSDKMCFHFQNDLLITEPVPEPIDHWEIVRNLPTVCSTESSGSDKEEQSENAPAENAPAENVTAENETTTEELTTTEAPTEARELCKKHCWKKALPEDLSFSDGLFVNGTKNETGCKHACTNNEACVGVYWGFNPSTSIVDCWLQIPSKGVSASLTNVNHWALSNCTDDCFPYCWKPKVTHVQTFGGVFKRDIVTEDQCKAICSEDQLCDGVDFNPSAVDVYCWHLFKHRRTAGAVYHWEIVRNLPTNCTKSDEMCTPHCWNKTELPVLNFADGLFKKGDHSEMGCKELCANNQTCIGVYYGLNSNSIVSCYFQMPYETESQSLTNVSLWSLANCTGDCLPYCWMRKWEHIQTAGGVRQSNEYDENGCKVLCANDHSCQGIDWNVTGSSCWLLYEHRLILNPTSDPVHHWELAKNLPTVCSSEPSEVVTLPASEEPETEETEGVTAATEAEVETEPETTEGATPPMVTKQAPEVGEAIVAKSAKLRSVPKRRPKNCPNYIIGIFTMAGLMGICVFVILGLIAYITTRHLKTTGVLKPDATSNRG